MKLAIFVPSLAGGGAERIALFVTDTLVKAGYDVDLVVARNVGSLVDHPIAREHRVDLKAANEMLCLRQLVRYVDEVKPQLLFASIHSAKIMAGFAKKARPWLPLAISVHNNLDLPRFQRFWPRAIFGFALERWLYRDVRAVHTVSKKMARQAIRAFAVPESIVRPIYNPVLERGGPSVIDPRHIGYFDRPVLVNAGRLVTQKNHAALIAAFHASGMAGTARLLILGEGPLRPALEKQIRSLGLEGSVLLPGFVPDIRAYLERAQGFVLSSRNEGLPLVLLEALSAGIPVAAFDCPTGPDEILDHGAFGRLVPPGDVAGLAAAMRDMLSGVLSAPPAHDIVAHMQAFQPEHVGQQYLAFIESLINGDASDYGL